MKSRQPTGRLPGILCLLLAFLLSASMPLSAAVGSAGKSLAAGKKEEGQKTIAAAKADQAVVPFFSLKLQHHYFITPEPRFFVIRSERPRHPDAFPIYLSTYFANIFSKAIAINAP